MANYSSKKFFPSTKILLA